MSRLREIQKDLGLVPSGKPGEFVRPVGINMHTVPLDAVTSVNGKNGHNKGVEMHVILPERSHVEDGGQSRGLIGALRGGRLRHRVEQVVKKDRREVGEQKKLEKEAATLQERLQNDPRLKKEFDGVVASLPLKEQANLHKIIENRGSGRAQVMGLLNLSGRADEARKRLREDAKATGKGFGDAALVTPSGLQIYEGGSKEANADFEFAFSSIVNGRLEFSVADRDKRKRRLGPFANILPGTVRVYDKQTDRSYMLRGVPKPDEFIDDLLQTAQSIFEGDRAKVEVLDLLTAHPEMLEDA